MSDFFGGNLHKDEGKKPDPYFNQEKQRSVEFIAPSMELKKKVGEGGLTNDILLKAQNLIEKNTIDFIPSAQRNMSALSEGIRLLQTQQHRHEIDSLLATISAPAMQLKANGGMFGYPLITKICELFIRFLEVMTVIDKDAIDIIRAFHTALNAVIVGQIKGDGAKEGQNLYQALDDACHRYFEKNKK